VGPPGLPGPPGPPGPPGLPGPSGPEEAGGGGGGGAAPEEDEGGWGTPPVGPGTKVLLLPQGGEGEWLGPVQGGLTTGGV
jgi:hypothetical protein